MIYEIFAIYDTKVKEYLPLFTARNAADAARLFQNEVNDPRTNFAKHPADFVLFKFGVFDATGGVFEMHEPQNVASAISLVYEENQSDLPMFTKQGS